MRQPYTHILQLICVNGCFGCFAWMYDCSCLHGCSQLIVVGFTGSRMSVLLICLWLITPMSELLCYLLAVKSRHTDFNSLFHCQMIVLSTLIPDVSCLTLLIVSTISWGVSFDEAVQDDVFTGRYVFCWADDQKDGVKMFNYCKKMICRMHLSISLHMLFYKYCWIEKCIFVVGSDSFKYETDLYVKFVNRLNCLQVLETVMYNHTFI